LQVFLQHQKYRLQLVTPAGQLQLVELSMLLQHVDFSLSEVQASALEHLLQIIPANHVSVLATCIAACAFGRLS